MHDEFWREKNGIGSRHLDKPMKQPVANRRATQGPTWNRRHLFGAISGGLLALTYKGNHALASHSPASPLRPSRSRWSQIDAYDIRDLGTLPSSTGTRTDAADVNEAGWVVGQAGETGGPGSRAFLWRDGAMADLGAFPDTGLTGARAINDSGQVVGYSGQFEGAGRAFLWESGKLTDLGSLPGSVWVSAFSINNVGDVVGYGTFASVSAQQLPYYAFLYRYQDGSFVRLGTLGGDSSWAYGINNRGEIVGTAETESKARHAFLYQNDEMVDLGTLPGDASSTALAISDAGMIVGRSGLDPRGFRPNRPFLWSNGQMIELGTEPNSGDGEALDINASGQVVGFLSRDDGTRAFIYAAETGQLTDLNDLLPDGSGRVLNQAAAINEAGQIVGRGTIQGEVRAFLLSLTRSSGQSSENSLGDQAVTAALEMSLLEAVGDFDTLYDLMHPDARAVIPREAVVGWYETDFAPLGPTPIVVTGVRFAAWTWPVTGHTYPETAEVSYRQRFADGSEVDGVTHLVQDGQVWSWFFGGSRQFVDEQIARFGEQSIQGAPANTVANARYQVDDLGTGDGDWSIPYAIAEDGTVLAGWATATDAERDDISGPIAPFLWQDGTIVDLRRLGLEHAYSLDAHGDVLANWSEHEVVYQVATGEIEPRIATNPIVPVPPGYLQAVVMDTNSSGQSAGPLYTNELRSGFDARGFVFTSNSVLILDAAPGASQTRRSKSATPRRLLVGRRSTGAAQDLGAPSSTTSTPA